MQGQEAKVLFTKAQLQGFANLKAMIRKKFCESLSNLPNLKNVTHADHPQPDDFVYNHWMAIILISGSELRITLKVHFSLEAAFSMMARAGIETGRTSKAQKLAFDFVKEHCNVAAGSIKRSLNASQIPVGLSIPLVTRGFDEAIFSDKIDAHKFNEIWVTSWDDLSITCSAVIEVLDAKNIGHFVEHEEPEDEGVFL